MTKIYSLPARAIIVSKLSTRGVEANKKIHLVNEASWSLQEIGLMVHPAEFHIENINSLGVLSIMKQTELVLMDVVYAIEAPMEAVAGVLTDANRYGCALIFYNSGRRPSGSLTQLLKQEAIYCETINHACEIAKKFADNKTVNEHNQRLRDLSEEKPSLVMKDDGTPKIYEINIGNGLSLNFYESTIPCSPHPFDDDDLEEKLKFIYAYGHDKVIVCGVLRVDSEKDYNKFGYVIDESCLDLPDNWKQTWSSLLMSNGFTEVINSGWNISYYPKEHNKLNFETVYVGGKDFLVDGSRVVQRAPFCLCMLQDA